jgi:uncharacterized membrane protein
MTDYEYTLMLVRQYLIARRNFKAAMKEMVEAKERMQKENKTLLKRALREVRKEAKENGK